VKFSMNVAIIDEFAERGEETCECGAKVHGSLGLESGGRIGVDGAESGGQRGEHGRSGDGQERDGKHGRVGGTDLVEDVGEIMGGENARENTEDGPGGDGYKERQRNQLGNAGGSCADGHADSNFAAPLLNGIVKNTVKADGGEKKSDKREERRERGQEAFADGLTVDEFGLGVDVADTKVGAKLRNDAAQRRSEGERIGGGGADDEGSPFGAPPGFGVRREEREVGGGQGVLADAGIFGVASDPDNLKVRARTVRKNFVEGFADDIFVVEEGASKGLIDDGSTVQVGSSLHRSGRDFGWKKITAVDKRKLESFEPAGRNVAEVSEVARWAIVDGDFVVIGKAGEESVVADRDAFDSRSRTKLIGNLKPSRRRDGLASDGIENEETVRGETDRLMREPLESGDEKPSDEKNEAAEADLGTDQEVHQEATPRMRVFPSLKGAGGLSGGGAKGGKNSEETGDQEGEQDKKEEDAEVRGKGEAHGIVCWIDPGDNERRRPRSEEAAEDGGDHSKNGALHEDKLEKVTASGPDGDAQSHFASAGGGLGDEKVGDVGASDKQNEEDESGQREESGAIVLLKAGSSGGSAVEVEGLIEFACNFFGRFIGPRFGAFGFERATNGIEFGAKRLGGYARPNDGEDTMPGGIVAGDAGMHHGGEKNLDHGAGFCAGERRVANANDLENVIADTESFANHVGIVLEAAGPVIVRDDGDGMSTGSGVVVGSEKAAESRRKAKGGEHVAGDIVDVGLLHVLIGFEGEIAAVFVGDGEQLRLTLGGVA